MGLLGDFVRAILYLTVAGWLLSIVSLYGTGQTFLASLLLVGFLIPLSMIAYGYFRNRRK